MSAQKVTDATFETEVMQSELPVLVDFYADWCEPCKKLTPIVDEVGRQLAGKLKVVQINIDQNPVLAQMFRVQSIPMLAVVHQGRVAAHRMGLVDAKTILEMVRPVLPADAAEVTPADLARLLKLDRAVPVDVRDQAAFERYRIPGAVHLAAAEVAEKSAQLRATDGRIRVLYARSTDEAKALAEALRQRGVEVGFLSGGFLHWEADGFEIEKGLPSQPALLN